MEDDVGEASGDGRRQLGVVNTLHRIQMACVELGTYNLYNLANPCHQNNSVKRGKTETMFVL